MSTIRERLLNSARAGAVEAVLHGEKIVLLRLSVETALALSEHEATDTRAEHFARLLVNFAHDPETLQPIFTVDDIPEIVKMPFDGSVQDVQLKIVGLIGIKKQVEIAEGNSEGTASDTQ